ncbi:outer membrane lipoprotein chaperone LolA [Burkholderia sp. JKS000303]|uniref:outer membrane lipoprotein chaperone LolA n=1 Tax=Burkholderia sp. JKS000303 TaxID=1938747 RepID=UPI000BF7EEEF|nr:outer membrane lipoprotein chaperone LolA [Burkholderia sp. JKS000303]PFH26837.1 outer membrane lipoprotein carrier protein [Burkholderia sp. JKS000303]
MQQLSFVPSLRSTRRWLGAAFAGASLMLAATHAFAGGTEQLKAFVSQVHAAKGDFTQQIVKAPSKATNAASAAQAMPKPNDNSSGTFVFSRPGKFIWTYQKPYQQVLQADGDKLYVYDRDLNQVTERKLNGALGASPAAILFGSNDLDKNYTLHDAGEKGGIEWLEMLPKAQDTQFQRIGIGFRNGTLAAMELHDVFGNVTLLTFTNIQTNPPLKSDTFKFVVPKGADVITG